MVSKAALVALFALALLIPVRVVEASPASTEPEWVKVAVRNVLASDRAEFGAKPLLIRYLSYAKKIAVVVEYDRIVRRGEPCATYPCPGGRVLRFSFDRATHRPNGEGRYCDIRGNWPPLERCLAR